MDPLSIASTVDNITGVCLKTAMLLDHLRSRYQNASLTISALCSECTLITASLTEVQTYVLQNPGMHTRPELRTTFDMALTGCMVIFSCLDQEVQKISEAGPSKLTWRSKARFAWNEDSMKEYLSQIRGQQAALSFLIQILHIQVLLSLFLTTANQPRRSIDEIHQKLVGNRTMLQRQSMVTKSLRAAHPKINVPASIFGDSKYAPSIYGDASTIFTAAEFEFDDTIINSKAYRRALAVARFKSSSSKSSIQADLKAEKSNADSSSPKAGTDAEQRDEKQKPFLERTFSEQIIDFDLIDLNIDAEGEQAVNIAHSSMENSWGLSEIISHTTLLDKPPEFALIETPSSGIYVLSPQVRLTERITKNFNSPRPTNWPPRRFPRRFANQYVSLPSKSNHPPKPSPGLPVKTTPVIIKFDKHSRVDQAMNIFLRNPNDCPILFVVKTTAPNKYYTTPNRGQIEPGELFSVEIVLVGLPKTSQVLKGSQPPNYHDKFLVRSFTIAPGEKVPNWAINFENRRCAEVKMRVEFRKVEPVEEGVATNQRARAGSF